MSDHGCTKRTSVRSHNKHACSNNTRSARQPSGLNVLHMQKVLFCSVFHLHFSFPIHSLFLFLLQCTQSKKADPAA